jgi:hypothetical protein
MNWQGKEIQSLTDEELWAALQSVADMDNFRFDKLKDPRINKLKHRLNKIFNSNPPIENQTFTNLVEALNKEWKKRNEN